jgi:hypothetical protein
MIVIYTTRISTAASGTFRSPEKIGMNIRLVTMLPFEKSLPQVGRKPVD